MPAIPQSKEEVLNSVQQEIGEFLSREDHSRPSISLRRYFETKDGGISSVWITASLGVSSKPLKDSV